MSLLNTIAVVVSLLSLAMSITALVVEERRRATMRYSMDARNRHTATLDVIPNHVNGRSDDA